MMVDMDRLVNIIMVTSGFGLKVMLERSHGVSGTCIFQPYCGT